MDRFGVVLVDGLGFSSSKSSTATSSEELVVDGLLEALDELGLETRGGQAALGKFLLQV